MDNDLITSYIHAQYGESPREHSTVLTLDDLTANVPEQLQLILSVSRDRRHTTRQRFVYDQVLQSGSLFLEQQRIQDSILPFEAEPEAHPVDGLVATLADTFAVLHYLGRDISAQIPIETNGVDQQVVEYLREQVTPKRLKQQLEPESIYQLLGNTASRFVARLSGFRVQAAGRRVVS